MSSNTTVQWHSQLSLGNAAPAGWKLEDFTRGAETVLADANKVIDFIQGLINLVSPFINGPTELLADLIKEFSKPILTVLQDSLSLGGDFIVIHPYNRMTRRYTNILTDATPFLIPAMTPREAFQELYRSFSNTSDPFRPQWTDDIYTAGVGILVTLPDVKGFVSLMQSFSKLVDMKDIKDAIKNYQDEMGGVYLQATKAGLYTSDTPPRGMTAAQKQEWNSATGIAKRRELQTKYALNLGDAVKSDISTIFTSWKPSKISFDFGTKGGSGTFPSFTNSNALPRLHWYGLNISNFTFLKKMVDRIDDIIKTLLGFSEANNKLVENIIAVLLKKVQALRDLVQKVYDLIEGIAISLYSAGIYAFVIPPTPAGQTGGVNYIIDSLKASLGNPPDTDAKTVVSTLDATDNTLLFFAGASTGVNLDAWMKLFSDAFLNLGKTASSLFDRKKLQFSVTPNLDGTVIPFNKGFTLKVVSSASTNTTQLYYTYVITSSSGTVYSSYISKNVFSDAAKVNSSTFDIKFQNPTNITNTENYSIVVEVFDDQFNSTSVTYQFQVSNVATLINGVIDSTGQAALLNVGDTSTPSSKGLSGSTTTSTSTSGGTLDVIDPSSPTGTEIIQHIPFTGTTPTIGSLPPFIDPVKLQVTTNEGTSVTFPVINNTGYDVLTVTLPIKSKYAFNTYPGKLHIDINGVIAYRPTGTTTWTYLNLPGFLTIMEDSSFDYMLYLSDGPSGNNNWQGPHTTKIGTLAEGEVQVC